MPAKKSTNSDYQTLRSTAEKDAAPSSFDDLQTLKPAAAKRNPKPNDFSPAPETLVNQHAKKIVSGNLERETPDDKSSPAESFQNARENSEARASPVAENNSFLLETEQTYSEQRKQTREKKRAAEDDLLLSRDRWLTRNGHNLTYAGIFLFTLVVYFRPYEMFPALSGLTSMAMILAFATVLIYLPSQFTSEGTLTAFPVEVKCILFISFWALLTIPIAKSPADAWGTFDVYSKIVLIFIVMANTVRTRARVKGLMWLGISVGVMHGFTALDLYRQGIFKTDGTRVNVDSVGMFGNPNDLALHLAMFVPVAVALGVASKNKLSKLAYFIFAAIMFGGNIVTQSRGGFLGLIAACGVLAWKLGKGQRFKVVAFSAATALVVIAFAPGNYGMRLLSIFDPSLDTSGSSDQRSALLKQSIIVTLRNPQGIGMGNFPIVGTMNLHTHNAYTQVSSELGVLCLVAYVVMMVSPLKKLAAIERRMFADSDFSWTYYATVGVEACIVGYMVASFFGPVAYNWFVYYPIAYAICLRRMYRIEKTENAPKPEDDRNLSDYFNLQKA